MDLRERSAMVTALKRFQQSGHEEPPRPGEGLREQKKRLTRQHLSDTATFMFLEHGFEAVKITDVAAACGVSEKTVYNYFPTKESLLLDREEQMSAAIRLAITGNSAFSPVEAAVRLIGAELEDMRGLLQRPEDAAAVISMFRAFGDMVTGTPSLRAAQRDMMDRMVQVAAAALAQRNGLSQEDPETQIAGDAICGLWRIQFRAMHRYADGQLAPELVFERVNEDVRRAARVIETGLWASGLAVPTSGSREQLKAAADAAVQAKRQVHLALRQAKAVWRDALKAEHEAARVARRSGKR